jgi:type II secretory pathway pseudopilin PulG
MSGHHANKDRSGFSLLEVLVACGILVIGLASIAAILPAAGARLAEATATDRAAALAAIAMSEIQARGLVSPELFMGTPAASGSAAVVFGQSLPAALAGTLAGQNSAIRFRLANNTSLVSGTAVGNFVANVIGLSGTGTLSTGAGPNVVPRLTSANPTFLTACVNNRIFFLEDPVQFRPSGTTPTPANSFASVVAASGTIPTSRAFTPGLCWGAMVVPEPFGTATGTTLSAASVSVAVFRKPGNAVVMTLSDTTGSGIFTGTNFPATVQRGYLKSCTYVLAVPPPALMPAARPQWLKVRSSWISGSNPLQTSSTGSGVSTIHSGTIGVVFESGTLPAGLARPVSSGSSICVIGFENLLLVDEKILTIR